jgi:uncharacterized radical SAM superfamily protein
VAAVKALVLNLPDARGENAIKDLFNGAWCRGARIGGTVMPPLTLLYAQTALASAGVETRLLDAILDRTADVNRAAQGVDLVVAHSSAYTFDEDLDALLDLRTSASVFLFGNLTDTQIRRATGTGAADFVTARDPEPVLTDLVAAGMDGRAVASLHTADGLAEGVRPLGVLDDIQIPDRRPILGYRYRNLLAVTDRWTTALTSRGCPHSCTFCNTPGYYGRSYRMHSLEYVLEELHRLWALGYREVFFRDDLFRVGAVPEFCDALLSANLPMRWSCNHRVDTLDAPTLRLMKRAGCHTIKFGVESGDDEVLQAIGKPPSAVARATFAACADLGIRTHAHLLIGLPGESRAAMDRTVRLLDAIDPYTFTVNMFTPAPGSTEHARGGRVGGVWKEAVVGNPSDVDDAELRDILRRTYLRGYLSPRRIARIAQDRRRWRALWSSGVQLVRRFAVTESRQ